MSANDELQAHTCEKMLEFYEKPQDYVKKSHNEQDLTEKWKKGELQGGWYFLEFEIGSKFPVYYCGFNREFEFGWDWKISKVLARCSYEEFDNITKCYLCAHEKADRLEKENQQLKELLYSLKCCLTSENIEPQIRIDKSLGKMDEVLK